MNTAKEIILYLTFTLKNYAQEHLHLAPTVGDRTTEEDGANKTCLLHNLLRNLHCRPGQCIYSTEIAVSHIYSLPL